MKLNRFTRLKLLKGIGRPMLGKLFDRFSSDLALRCYGRVRASSREVAPVENLEPVMHFWQRAIEA